MMGEKGQAVLEYLMVYGWAIAVFGIVAIGFFLMFNQPVAEKPILSEWQGEWKCIVADCNGTTLNWTKLPSNCEMKLIPDNTESYDCLCLERVWVEKRQVNK